MNKEAMKLALEALEKLNNTNSHWWQEVDENVIVQLSNAESALREALAEQPAQQDMPKIGCVNHDCDKCKEQQQQGPINEGWHITVANGHSGYGVYAHMKDYPEEGAALVQAIDQSAQQEPSDLDVWKARALQAEAVVAKFMAPQPAQRTWVGLTDEDYLKALDEHPYEGSDRELWLVLEAKLKEKNT